MNKIYFVARLGTSDVLVHGYTWKHKLTEHLERLSLGYGIQANFIHAVHTDYSRKVQLAINKELSAHKLTDTLLRIDTHDPVIVIMDKYDGETIDPTYKETYLVDELAAMDKVLGEEEFLNLDE